MPTAGAIIPPLILPLRQPIPGVPGNHIDTTTFVELATESPDCKIYFTTDGGKPNPFQLKIGGRESTFKYRGPFTMKPGKRTVKTMAITRDGFQESNVVTKTFIVEDAGIPTECEDESNDLLESMFDNESVNSYRPNKSKALVSSSHNFTKKKKNQKNSKKLKEAWASTTADYIKPAVIPYEEPERVGNMTNTAGIPDGCSPTNYSGTQINFWGCAPNLDPGKWAQQAQQSNGQIPYGNPYPSQLGYLTNKMISGIEGPKISLEELKTLYANQNMQEYKDPQLKNISEGCGDWKDQLRHIHAQLIEECKNNEEFRSILGAPKMGKLVTADFDNEENAYLITLSFAKPGKPMRKEPVAKPKPKPKEEPPPQKVEPPKPKPKPSFKAAGTAIKAVKKIEKPKPEPKKPEPKPEPKKHEDPYFVTEEYECEGTLKPWPAFDAEKDCERLRAAMKGMGTDEKTIIDIMGYRSSVQRTEVCKMFKTMFGKDLKDELAGETSGNFKEALKALCRSAPDYDAYEINRAVKGLGTDEDALIEILCTRTNAQIVIIKEAYKKMYDKEMEKDVRGDTSGNFKKVLNAQMAAGRDESPTFDQTAARADAQALYNAGEGKWGTDESKFNEILCQRSNAHLRGVFAEYKKISGKEMEEAIKSEFSGDIKNSLVTLVRVIKDKPAYFALKLQKAMKGLGTDDQALIRIVVTRCECDLVQIMNSFQTQFGKSLGEWVRDDTSGDYQELILALIGNRPAPTISAEEMAEANEPQEIEEVEEEVIPEDPTVKPVDPFDPKRDCEILRKAMKGLGTDEDAIISIMPFRSNEQRMELMKMYNSMYGKNLKDELKSETSGNFKAVLVGLCQTPIEFDCDQLRKSMKGLGTDEDCLIEILCSRTKSEMEAIVTNYKKMFNKSLEDDIVGDTSGHFKRILVSMVQANRPEGNTVNRTKARKDAKDLYEAGDNKFGTDESRFNVILCSRSYPQLRATFEEYKKSYGKDIEQVISEEMSGDIKKSMLTIVRNIRNKAQAAAKTLYDSMHGLGTNDDSLIRTVISRCERDMVQIKASFQQAYKGSLGEWIRDDTSGDYRKTLLHLVGESQLVKK